MFDATKKILKRLVYNELAALYANSNYDFPCFMVRALHQQVANGLLGRGFCNQHHLHRQHGDPRFYVVG